MLQRIQKIVLDIDSKLLFGAWVAALVGTGLSPILGVGAIGLVLGVTSLAIIIQFHGV